MLLITDEKGSVLGAWSGDRHSLATIYPGQPEIQAQFMEYLFEDNPEVLRDPTAYEVHVDPTDGEPHYGEPYYDLRVPTNEELLTNIRKNRDALLFQCDWTQLPDVPFSILRKNDWAVYRQALRDMPGDCDPNNPVWPVPPA